MVGSECPFCHRPVATPGALGSHKKACSVRLLQLHRQQALHTEKLQELETMDDCDMPNLRGLEALALEADERLLPFQRRLVAFHRARAKADGAFVVKGVLRCP